MNILSSRDVSLKKFDAIPSLTNIFTLFEISSKRYVVFRYCWFNGGSFLISKIWILERFKFIVELLPLQYKKVYPQEKIIDNNNPPDMEVEFFKDQKINNINCYSNEGNGWDSSKLKIENNILKINFRDKFNTRRGRINCSMKDEMGWRWFGMQFIVKNIKEN